MKLSAWMDWVIRIGFVALFVLVPLVLTPLNYELFEYNKMMVTYVLTVIIAAAWMVKMAANREFRINKTPLDIPILVFLSSQLLSTLFSMDPHVSWFGYYSRFNGGMMSVISYVLLYYAFVSNFGSQSNEAGQSLESRIMNHESGKKKKKNEENKPLFIIHNSLFILLKIALLTAGVVSIYGVLERLGIDKSIWVQDVQNRVFSTLGQPNWLAAYLVALIPTSIVFALQHAPNPKKTNEGIKLSNMLWYSLWAGLTLLFFVVLLFTRSRSGMLALAVADIVFWTLYFLKLDFKVPQRRTLMDSPVFITAAILHAAFALIVFINGTHIAQLDSWVTLKGWQDRLTNVTTTEEESQTPAGPLLEVGGTESGTIRKYVWQGAINAWLASPKNVLIGTGTETFAFAFYQYRPAGHNMTSEWDFLYNKAHNEFLNYLATTGILGLGSYLFLLGSFIYWFIKKTLSPKLQTLNPLEIALFSGWLSILITNFLGFSVVIVQLMLFLLPAMIFVLTGTLEKENHQKISETLGSILTLATFTIGGLLVLWIFLIWYTDTLYAKGYRQARGGAPAYAYQSLLQAAQLNFMEPVYKDELASTLASLAVASMEQKDATGAASLAQRSIKTHDAVISMSPNNVNFWKTRTKIFYTLAALDPSLNRQAIEALEKANELSPNDPKILYNLAILYGRENSDERAVELLKLARELKPNYRDAYFGLHVFYTELKKPQEARAILEEYLKNIDPTDKDFLERVKK